MLTTNTFLNELIFTICDICNCVVVDRPWRLKLHKFLQLWKAAGSQTGRAWSKTVLSS